MRVLNPTTAAKLQRILAKRVGRELNDSELEQAYYALMGFAETLLELSEPEIDNYPIADNKSVSV